jgi:hypothetical protein
MKYNTLCIIELILEKTLQKNQFLIIQHINTINTLKNVKNLQP